jgi:Meiotically up-regulated gene 113
VKLKVGRAVNLVKRIDQWGKQCGSKEQVLRGWWPSGIEDDKGTGVSLMKGRVKAGKEGPCCHRLERLVHLELADLSVNAQYLNRHFPNIKKSDNNTASTSSSAQHTTSAAKRMQHKPCADCKRLCSSKILMYMITTNCIGGQVHKEIFVFTRVESGSHVGKEWENVVQPVIEKWGQFVTKYV